jgi:hypothetical protein
MTAKNDVTGDLIASKQPNDAYRNGWDAIFSGRTTLQPNQHWRGLTTAEVKTLWNISKKPTEFAAMIEAKLKEKNS